MNGVLGVILAGGRARRMGGGDKGLLEIGGVPLLTHVQKRLAPQCSRLLLNANGDPERFADFGLEVIADSVPDHPGPLGGLLAGLEWVRDRRSTFPYLVTAAADTPFFPGNMVRELHRVLTQEKKQVALAATEEESGVRLHPAFGLWSTEHADALHTALVQEGVRRVIDWAERLGYVQAVFPADTRDPFFNVNTPEDLTRAAQWLEEKA